MSKASLANMNELCTMRLRYRYDTANCITQSESIFHPLQHYAAAPHGHSKSCSLLHSTNPAPIRLQSAKNRRFSRNPPHVLAPGTVEAVEIAKSCDFKLSNHKNS